jgi:hypothetical protein
VIEDTPTKPPPSNEIIVNAENNDMSSSSSDETTTENEEGVDNPRETIIESSEVVLTKEFIQECQLLTEPERIAKLMERHKLDYQYYYGDDDRLKMSRVTDLERNQTILDRKNMIQM